MATSADDDYYALLAIEPTATAAVIGKAYRRKALTCHPDKVGPDNTAAAEMFIRLTKAVEVLTDDAKRKIYDALYRARQQQHTRLREMDARRRKDRDDLVAREAAAASTSKNGSSTTTAETDRKRTIERLREEGARQREAYEQQRRQAAAASVALANTVESARRAVASADILDCTLRFKWRKKSPMSESDLLACVASLAQVDKIVMSKSGKPSASVVFKDLYGAYAVMEAKSGSDAKQLQYIQIDWALGEPPKAASQVPVALLGQSYTNQPTSTPRSDTQQSSVPSSTPFPQFIPTQSTRMHTASGFPLANPSAHASMNSYEELTLRRMQQRERDALKQQLLEQEAKEDLKSDRIDHGESSSSGREKRHRQDPS